MSELSLYIRISSLPGQLRNELSDYLDFLITKKGKKKKSPGKHPRAGCMKGTFIINSEFDKPLEDFKEYME